MKQSILGIGRKLILYTALYAGFATTLTALYPNFFLIRSELNFSLRALGYVFLAFGIFFLILSVRQVMREFQEGVLMKEGVFRYSRNPIYTAWGLFILPGLSLLTASWIFFGTPLIFYFVFKIYIREEEEFLENHFGEEYLEYKEKTGQLLPRFGR